MEKNLSQPDEKSEDEIQDFEMPYNEQDGVDLSVEEKLQAKHECPVCMNNGSENNCYRCKHKENILDRYSDLSCIGNPETSTRSPENSENEESDESSINDISIVHKEDTKKCYRKLSGGKDLDYSSNQKQDADRSTAKKEETRIAKVGATTIFRTKHKRDSGKNLDRPVHTPSKELKRYFDNVEESKNPLENEYEWVLKRENKFAIGDKLEVHCLVWEQEQYCWIRLKENYQLYLRIKKFVKENHERFPVVKPSSNTVFLTKHNGSWFRAKITGGNPKVIVRCVDTGMKFCPKNLICKQLDPDLAALEPLAFQVVVSETTKPVNLYCGLIRVKISAVKPKTMYEIKLLSGVKVLSSDCNRSKFLNKVKFSRRSVFDDLSKGMSGVFVSTNVHNTELLGMLVPDDIEEAIISFRHVRNLCCLDDMEIEANVEDFVLVMDRKRLGRRGVVKSKSSEYGYEVALLDVGYAVYTKKVFSVPKMALNLMDLACKMTITSKFPYPFKLAPDSKYYFEVKEKVRDGKWQCALKKDYEGEEFPGSCTLERVDETLHRIRYVPFGSGSTVVISALGTSPTDFTVFVRRVDPYYMKKLKEIDDLLDKIPENDDVNYRKTVSPGDIIAAKYKDGHYYRALILYKTQKNVSVLYIDYGHKSFAKQNHMKPLPYNLIKKPVQARRVMLSGFPEPPKLGEGNHLENLMKTSHELILYYTGDMDDGVQLLEKEVYDINREILSNNASQKPKYFDTFTERFFEGRNFSSGLIEKFKILYVDPQEFENFGIFWGANPNNFYITRSLNDALKVVGDHCKSDKEEYSPQCSELCFVLFEGIWHRGLAVEVQGSDFQVFLVDWGKTVLVQSRSIRKMNCKYFLSPPLAMKCVLEDFEAMRKEDFYAAYDYLLRKVNKSIEDVEVVSMNDGMSVVRIPQIYGI